MPKNIGIVGDMYYLRQYFQCDLKVYIFDILIFLLQGNRYVLHFEGMHRSPYFVTLLERDAIPL